jgi:cytidylate kinase
MIIAIDGTAASGKGTLAKKMGCRLNLAHLDTGALYRITGQMLRNDGISHDGVTAKVAAEAAENLDLTLMDDPNIRSAEASEMATIVASIPEVRTALLAFQKNFAKHPPRRSDSTDYSGAVLDGRDIGTVILPDADVKFFVNASPDVRAERRLAELTAAGAHTDFDTVKEALIARDEQDYNREIAPLKPAKDSIIVDTTHLGIEEMIDFACGHLPK